MLVEMKVKDFIAELASDSPAPGGGSVAAISGSLGAGLLTMVCRLTIGKKGYEQFETDMRTALEDGENYCRKLTVLVDEDTNAFNQVMAAFKMPKESAEQKEVRTATIQSAFKKAADTPFTIAENCMAVLTLAEKIVNKANTNAISDVGVAAQVAFAGLESAAMNVKINLPSIKDAEYVKQKSAQVEKMLIEGKKKSEEIYQIVGKQLS